MRERLRSMHPSSPHSNLQAYAQKAAVASRARALLRRMRSGSVKFYGGPMHADIKGTLQRMLRAVQKDSEVLQLDIHGLVEDAHNAIAEDEDPPIMDVQGHEKLGEMMDRATKAYVQALQQALSQAQRLH